MRDPNNITARQQGFIESLRRELGIKTTKMPATSREASNLIKALLERKKAAERRAVRQVAAAAPPSIETRRSIEALAARLGVEVQVPSTSAEAGFVLDDLRHREWAARRVADGSAG